MLENAYKNDKILVYNNEHVKRGMAMKLWMRKLFVALVAVITLGLYVPPAALNTNTDSDNKDTFASKSNIGDVASSVAIVTKDKHISDHILNDRYEVFNKDKYVDLLVEKAKEQAIVKLGPKISRQIGNEFAVTIFPAMESVLRNVLEKAGDEGTAYYAVTEEPVGGLGEKIFNVYDVRNEQDIARFDVRRENRPLEGYWFNFHYHLNKDNFEKHYEIGEIYWDKNEPPRWMA